ncbi:hypothetical protein Q8W25_17615 [Shimia thalassica]|uniref:hypothetical protein n=1 Tax=Shimia thalassica TaxID=1715693 RepID=UPI0027344D23|nr:hypothetical protein [Shimia thalassica]MDP2495850.1 hypothetical protein [Shimia thalassica]
MNIQVKRGASLMLSCVDDRGDMTGATITASVRQKGFSAALTFRAVDLAAGQYEISATATETATWPLGLLSCDIKTVLDDSTDYTETFIILMQEAITP